jgi:hypothetical protein
MVEFEFKKGLKIQKFQGVTVVGEDLDGGGGAWGEERECGMNLMAGARVACTSTAGARVAWASMVEAVGAASR